MSAREKERNVAVNSANDVIEMSDAELMEELKAQGIDPDVEAERIRTLLRETVRTWEHTRAKGNNG